MKRFLRTPATARVAALDAHSFDRALFEFLKMFGVAALGGLFFSLVAGLLVVLVASPAYAQGSPQGVVAPEGAVIAQAADAHEHLPVLRYLDDSADEPDLRAGEIVLGGGCGAAVLAEKTETDVYADVAHGTARVRLTLTFRNPLPDAQEGLFLMTLPRGGTAQRTIVTVGDRFEDATPADSADATLARPLGEIAAGGEASVVVDFEMPVDVTEGNLLAMPFAAPPSGSLSLMIDIEGDNLCFDGFVPGMTVERNQETRAGFIVSAFVAALDGDSPVDPLVHGSDLRWFTEEIPAAATRLSRR